MPRGWRGESRRHDLARRGIKTGRKVSRKGSLSYGTDKKMFQPKKETEELTVDLPVTVVKKTTEIVTQKKMRR